MLFLKLLKNFIESKKKNIWRMKKTEEKEKKLNQISLSKSFKLVIC
jgi:hypothetical protein